MLVLFCFDSVVPDATLDTAEPGFVISTFSDGHTTMKKKALNNSVPTKCLIQTMYDSTATNSDVFYKEKADD